MSESLIRAMTVIICGILLPGCCKCPKDVTISILSPEQLSCGVELEWDDLKKEWEGINNPDICSNEPAYEVVGRVSPAAKGMVVLADIYAHEGPKPRWWPMSMGKKRKLSKDGEFSGYYCISDEGWNKRTFRFRSSVRGKVCSTCEIVVKR